MIRDLIFTSSYNSQLGCIIAMSKFYKKKENRKKIIIQISTRNDKKCEYSCFKDYFSLDGKEFDESFIIVKVNNIKKKFALLIFLIILKLSKLKLRFQIWEPRPSWTNSLFNKTSFKCLNLLDNKATNYYGDGFLSLCLNNKPFWLVKNKKDFITFEDFKFNKYFFLYDLQKLKLNNQFIEIEPKVIIKTFKELLENITLKDPDYNFKKELNKRDIVTIFPTTTFYETKRTSLEKELNLYVEYIKTFVRRKNNQIIIKPHPNSSPLKTKLLYSSLEKMGYNIIREKQLQKIVKSKLPIAVIPLELLCFLIKENLKISFEKIFISINSTATLSTLILYPKINYIKPFGRKLVYENINKDFARKRVSQEKKIMSFINKI